MEPLAVSLAVLAALVLVARGLLLFAPAATVRTWLRIVRSPTALRGFALLLGGLGTLVITTARPAHDAHGWIAVVAEGIGWAMLAVAAWLLAWPEGYRRVAETFLDAMDDEATLRAIGVIGVAVGLGIAWLAFAVVG